MVSTALATLGLLLIAAYFLATRPGADLSAEHARRQRVLRQPHPWAAEPPPLTADDITALPASLQRFLQRSGAVGRPRVRCFRAVFQAEMFRKPGGSAMPGPVEQFNVVQPPWRRLFFMQSRMAGLPVAVLHDYDGDRATMRVRLVQLLDVVNLDNSELARTETVTLLNDLCFFAPSALVGPQFTWHPLDSHQCEVVFTNGPHVVQARLLFDDHGDLVNFISHDRCELQADGALLPLPWSTPMGAYRSFAGRRVPTRGQAIWHRPDGDFVYGRMQLVDIQYDEAAAI